MEMNKYQVALNALLDEDDMYELARGFSFETDYTSEYDYEKAREYCEKTIQELIDKYASEEDISKRVQKEKLNEKQKERWTEEYCRNEQNSEYGWCQFDE